MFLKEKKKLDANECLVSFSPVMHKRGGLRQKERGHLSSPFFYPFVVFSNPDFQGVPDKNGYIFTVITNISVNLNIPINDGAADTPAT